MSRYGNCTANFKPMDIHSIIELYKFELIKVTPYNEIYALGNFEIQIYDPTEYECIIGSKVVELELLIEALNNID